MKQLKGMGFLRNISRGIYAITPEGQEFLKESNDVSDEREED
jgi:predicted transcriptional regulator